MDSKGLLLVDPVALVERRRNPIAEKTMHGTLLKWPGQWENVVPLKQQLAPQLAAQKSATG